MQDVVTRSNMGCASRSRRLQAQQRFNNDLRAGKYELNEKYLADYWIGEFRKRYAGFSNCARLPLATFVQQAAISAGLKVEIGESDLAKASGYKDPRFFRFYKN